MRVSRQFFFNQSGFTLIETFLGMAVMTISLLSVVTLSSYMGVHQRDEIQKAAVYDFKEELIVSLNNSRYWQNLVNKAGYPHPRLQKPMNSELACLRDGLICNEGEYDLTLFNTDTVIRFDALDPNAGFNSRGEVCNTFQAEGARGANCPFRFQLKWSPVCESGSTSCRNPLIRIQAELQHNPGLNFQMITADINFNYILVADPIDDPIFKNMFLYTNSDVLNLGTSALDIDLSQAVLYGGAISSLSFSAPATTFVGSSVTITGSTLHYVPANKYYGRDTIAMTVTGPSGNAVSGTITIGVMTPHTWLGPAAAGPIPGNTSTESNFCGVVVNGFCDRATYAPYPDIHYIFNDLCLSCEAILDSNAASVELAASYTSTVWLGGNSPNIGAGAQSTMIWRKFPLFWQKNGSFRFKDLGTYQDLVINNHRGPSNNDYKANEKAFVVTGGTFEAPAVTGSFKNRLVIVGAIDLSPNVFLHNNGIVELGSIHSGISTPPDINVINLNGNLFWNLSFGSNFANKGDNGGFSIQSSFTVQNQLGIYPEIYKFVTSADINTLCTWEPVGTGYGQVPGSFSTGITIDVQGQIDVRKYGGRGSEIGCKAPAIRFKGAGQHTIAGMPTKPATTAIADVLTWLNGAPPTPPQFAFMPFLLIDDPAVSVKITGAVGFRRGLSNDQNSLIDFSGSSIVLGNTDPGTAIFRPETVAGAIKNPLKDFYLMNSNGGIVEMRSRQMQVDGGMFLLMDNETTLQGDANPTEIHLHGDLVVGPGEHPKNQSLITRPVRAVIDGPNAQTVYGGTQAATFGRTGYDGQMPMDVHISKPAGSGTATFQGLLTVLRDFVYNSGPVSYATGSAIYIPDTGSDPYVHNLGMGGYIDDSNAYMNTVSINHNFRLVSNLFFKNFGWNDLNFSSTKTVEAAATGLRLRVLENFKISTMNQTSAFDKPVQSVGTNRFEIMPLYGYGGPQGVFRPVLEILTPNSEVVTMPQIDLGFSAWNQDGYVRAINYKGHLSVGKIWMDGQTWVCMYPSANANQSSLTATSSYLSGWIKPSVLMRNGQNLSPGSVTTVNGSFIGDSDPTYPCP